jgi:hypothetical protein
LRETVDLGRRGLGDFLIGHDVALDVRAVPDWNPVNLVRRSPDRLRCDMISTSMPINFLAQGLG